MTRSAASFPILCLALCLAAGAASAKTSDRNQTLNANARTVDCSMNESAPCLFTGDVHVTQGTLDIRADKADLRRSSGEITTAKLTGAPVKMKQQGDDGGWVNASATQIDYDLSSDTIVLTGNASVQQPGKGSITGGRIVYNTRTGQVQSGGDAGGGRVNMTFEPKNKAPAAGKDKPAEPPKQDEN
jgi:lipopolysaccharide export system protein LptA